MQRAEAVAIAQALSDPCPRAFSSDEQQQRFVKAVARAIRGWRAEPTRRAVDQLVATSRWLPTIAEVREVYAADPESGEWDPLRNMSPRGPEPEAETMDLAEYRRRTSGGFDAESTGGVE